MTSFNLIITCALIVSLVALSSCMIGRSIWDVATIATMGAAMAAITGKLWRSKIYFLTTICTVARGSASQVICGSHISKCSPLAS